MGRVPLTPMTRIALVFLRVYLLVLVVLLGVKFLKILG
jgi:hypothetical protein